MRKHGPWTIVQSREVYRDPWLNVRRDEVVRPDGAPGVHSVVHLKAGVCVLALDERGNVHLTEEFHYGVGRVTIEGVSGGVEQGETAEVAAERELREELGIVARKWTRLCCVDPFTASVVSPTQLFLAEELEFVKSEPEGTELIRRVALPLKEAVAWMLEGRITHAPTCVLLLLVERRQQAGPYSKSIG
jgi:ADP-ribose pyrophosphatase